MKKKEKIIKNIAIGITVPIFVSLIMFFSNFFFTEYPEIKAQTLLNKRKIDINQDQHNELKKDIAQDIMYIKDIQKQILSILMKG